MYMSVDASNIYLHLTALGLHISKHQCTKYINKCMKYICTFHVAFGEKFSITVNEDIKYRKVDKKKIDVL